MAGSRSQTLLRPSRDWTPLTQIGALTLSAGVITDVTRLAGVEGDGATYPASRAGVWPAATNLCANGGFETNTTGWDSAGGTVERSTDYAKFGTYSLKSTSTGNNGTYSTSGNRPAVTSGSAYTLSCWVYGITSGRSLAMSIDWRDGADGSGSNISYSSVTTVWSVGSWIRVTVTGTAPVGALSCRILLYGNGTSTYYLDGVQFEAGSIATPYIETDGGTASRVAGTVAAPRQFLNPDGGGMAIRYRAGMAYTGGVSAATRIRLLNALNGNNWMTLYYDYVTDKWLLGRDNGSGAGETVVSGVQSFALGDTLTIIAEWTSALLSIQIDNTAPVTAASTKAPLEANLPTTFGFGTAAEPPWGDLLWAYGWSGVLSTADRALLVALGDNDPLPHQLRGGAAPSFLAPFNGDGAMYRYAA